MIKAILGLGAKEMALCGCDTCAFEHSIAARHGSTKHQNREKTPLHNEGDVMIRLQAAGWSRLSGKLRCPRCEASRKAQFRSALENLNINTDLKGNQMTVGQTNVTQLREPTQKQKRLIIMALEDDYDDHAKCYKGAKTDKVLADELGDGILFGWVARVREDLFGPTGENEEINEVLKEIKKLQDDLQARFDNMDIFQKSLSALIKRVHAIIVAVGPRAGK